MWYKFKFTLTLNNLLNNLTLNNLTLNNPGATYELVTPDNYLDFVG
jgi:hypothetical protein